MRTEIIILPDPATILSNVRRMPGEVMKAIAAAVDEQHQHTIAHIQAARLSGDKFGPPLPPHLGILRTHTNRLRASIRSTPSRISGRNIESSIGSNIKYAGVHEFGFSGQIAVAPHKRKRFRMLEFAQAARIFKAKKLRQRKNESAEEFARRQYEAEFEAAQKSRAAAQERRYVTRRVRVADTDVVAHSRRANIPARAPIRRGIEDKMPEYEQAIQTAAESVKVVS